MTNDQPRTTWLSAQEGEREYWLKRCSMPVGVMYEMGEHLDLAWRLRSCSSASPRSVLDVGVGPMGTGLLWLFPDAQVKIGVDRLLQPSLNMYRLHPTDFIIGYIERYLSDRRFTILSSNEASGLGRLIGRRRMQCWVAVKGRESVPPARLPH